MKMENQILSLCILLKYIDSTKMCQLNHLKQLLHSALHHRHNNREAEIRENASTLFLALRNLKNGQKI